MLLTLGLVQKFNSTRHDCEMWLENGTILEEVFEDDAVAAIPRMLYNVRTDLLSCQLIPFSCTQTVHACCACCAAKVSGWLQRRPR